ncbi:tetratricopeptide repeat protein [bacterium]|nr:tetratricopeptide repeat protein [bacterium]
MDGAIADASQAIGYGPSEEESWLNRAVAREQKGATKEAIADLERFLELAPEHAQAPAVRAKIEKLREKP